MGKLVLSMFASLDGYIEAPEGFVGPRWSDDLARHWSGYALARARHLLYGRVNFEFNRAFWSAADTDPTSPAARVPYAGTMNRLPKTVVSRTLTGDPGWNGTVASDLAAAVHRLKQEVDGEIFCFGGAALANALVALDLADELRLMITPDLFGGGKRLFAPGHPRQPLELLETLRLDTGAVILHYRRAR